MCKSTGVQALGESSRRERDAVTSALSKNEELTSLNLWKAGVTLELSSAIADGLRANARSAVKSIVLSQVRVLSSGVFSYGRREALGFIARYRRDLN